jgi:hypothetical protein
VEGGIGSARARGRFGKRKIALPRGEDVFASRFEALPENLKNLIKEQQLAKRAAAMPFSLDINAIMGEYFKEPHSIYLIHLVSSLLHYVHRVNLGACYDAFDKIF